MLIVEEPIGAYEKFPFKDETYKIIGAGMNVFNELGNGFLEAVYQDALEVEFNLLGIPYKREVPYQIYYKGERLSRRYIADFIVYDEVVFELKAQEFLVKANHSQVVNYLKASNLKVGLLVNFGEKALNYKRFIK
ncbi:MAG: GxxExxY protein [Bacteroidota bacterium]